LIVLAIKRLPAYPAYALLAICLATSAAVSSPVPQFQDGDRVCFVGDSITHGGAYHSYVYLYYLTRFPDREIRIFNKGIGGDRARHVLNRFDTDISPAKPTVSTLMLGMNDVGRDLYQAGKENPAKKQEHLDTYFTDMAELIERFEAIGSEVIFISPTIYDETAELDRAIAVGANDALGKCAAFVRETASKKGKGYVDFYDAMLSINAELQPKDPSATVIGPDRVHPRPDFGHFVMAFQFLKAQAVPKFVSRIVVDAVSGKVTEAVNASVAELEASGSGISFTALEGALPYPQTGFIAKALQVVPFEAEMNQQLLVITGLDDGMFELSIDGSTIGSWSAAQFAQGINLAVLEATPQYRQALKVKQLNEERFRKQSRLRNVAYVFYSSDLSRSDVNMEDTAAVRAFLDAKLKAAEGRSWHGYLKQQYADYFEVRLMQEELLESLDALHEAIYQANQPVAHQFSIRKIK
jgi:endoglucanase